MNFSGDDDILIGVGVAERPGATQTIENFRAKLAQLRADLAETVAASKASAPGADLSAINATIGAFQKLGQQIDVTSQKEIANFRAEGDAISGFLAKLGATDAQMARIGATIAQVEQKSGAAAVSVQKVIPQDFAPRMNASAFAVRRGADALSSLTFAASTGAVSAKSLAPELGSVAIAGTSLAGASLLAATGIGALVTIGLTLIGVLTEAKKAAKDLDKPLEDIAGLSADVIGARAAKLRDDLVGLQQLKNQLLDIQKLAPFDPTTRLTRAAVAPLADALKRVPGIDPAKVVDADAIDKAIDKVDERIVALGAVQLKLSTQAQDAQAKADTEISRHKREDLQAAQIDVIAAIQGEAAARKKQREFDLQNDLDDIKTSGANEALQGEARKAANAKFNGERLKDDAEEAQKAAEARVAADVKASKALEESRVAAAKAGETAEIEAAQRSRDARLISERQFIAARLAAQLKEIDAEEQAQLKQAGQGQFDAERLAAQVVDPEKKKKALADAKDFEQQQTKIIADANAKRAQVQTAAAKDTAVVVRQLGTEIETIDVQVLEEQGRFLDAAKIQVQKEFRDALLEATAAGDQTAVASIQRRIRIALEQAQVRESEATAGRAISEGQASVVDTNQQLAAQLITQADARERIVAALKQEQQAILLALPDAEKLAADLPGDEQAQARLQRYNQQLAQLRIEIAHTGDQFFDLKVRSVDALEAGLAQGIDDSIAGAKNLKDAWAEAAQSIVDSIRKVISQMLAQLAIQKLLQFVPIFGTGIGDVADQFGGFNLQRKAAGGVFRGPGTGTSDSILAAVSTGEGIVTARAMRGVTEAGLHDLNAGRAVVVRRDSLRHYAEGGMVGAQPVSVTGNWKGESLVRLQASRDVILDVISSTAGQQVQLENTRRNVHATRSLLGP